MIAKIHIYFTIRRFLTFFIIYTAMCGMALGRRINRAKPSNGHKFGVETLFIASPVNGHAFCCGRGNESHLYRICCTYWIWTICQRPPFTRQKATFWRAKGHVLQAKRRHIGKPLTANNLQTGNTSRHKRLITAHELHLNLYIYRHRPPERIRHLTSSKQLLEYG